VARNRKRAKERRARRPTAGQVSQPGVATARAQRESEPDGLEAARGPLDVEPEGADEAPNPLEHATPDVELAEAQLALGRPELIPNAGSDEAASDDFDDEDDDEEDDEELEDEALAAGAGGSGGGDGSGSRGLEASPALPPQRRLSGNRLINFIQGSWRELQRVQWPDRRQVMQATGVVIGFVIVAGVFLGIADEIAGKLVTLILK
jgi:preprotein translocase subunit SecE